MTTLITAAKETITLEVLYGAQAIGSLRSKRFRGAKESEERGSWRFARARNGARAKKKGGGGGGRGRKRLPPSIVILKTAHLAFHA